MFHKVLSDIMSIEERRRDMMIFSNQNLKKLIIPLILEQALAITVGMADTMMISSVGEAAVSGVSLQYAILSFRRS